MAIRLPFFIVPEVLGTIAAGSEVAGHEAKLLGRHDAIGLTWQASDSGSAWVRGRFAGNAARVIDFVAMVAANATADTTIRVRLGTTQAQVDGSSAPYDSGDLPFIDPAIVRADGIYHSHLELDAPQSASWYRIDIGGHPAPVEISMLVMGRKIHPSRFWDFDPEFSLEDTGKAEINPYGVVDQQQGIKLRTLDFTLNWMTVDEWETEIGPMAEAVGTSGVIYLVFDPEPGPYRQRRTYMGYFRKAPFARGRRKPNTRGGDFQIRSFI